ncbi:MAG: LPXTG cell wall anchor domain-containing protein, partial [Clostridiales bacterium]|nr:LPXTG cell wall anchor domain-containing protein [Clostridiales bacterium]
TDLSATQSNGHSGLWVSTGHSNIYDAGGSVNANGTPTANGSYYWHLDICFETVTITYVYGNNGITEGDSADGTEAGTKVFIKGATMDYTPAITVPDGYEVAGYYEDAAFTTVWNAVNQPITEDTMVYIKLVSDTYELPSTGGVGTGRYRLAGMVICGVVGSFLYRRKRKHSI